MNPLLPDLLGGNFLRNDFLACGQCKETEILLICHGNQLRRLVCFQFVKESRFSRAATPISARGGPDLGTGWIRYDCPAGGFPTRGARCVGKMVVLFSLIQYLSFTQLALTRQGYHSDYILPMKTAKKIGADLEAVLVLIPLTLTNLSHQAGRTRQPSANKFSRKRMAWAMLSTASFRCAAGNL